MGKRVNWDKVRELRKMIKGQGLNLTEGSLMFGVPLWQLYAIGSEDKNSPELTVAEAKDESITTESPANSNVEDQDSTEKKRENSDIFTESPLPEEVQKLILEYRGKNPKTGFKRIEDHLKSDHLVVVNRKQIRHVLKIHGLLESNDSSFDVTKPPKGTRRFEAAYAGELYQMDVTYVYLTGIPVLYLVVIVDDFSRLNS